LLRELAVVGDNHQAFAGFIESSHRENALPGINQVHHQRSTPGIRIRRNHPRWLVDREIFQSLGFDDRSIHANFLRLWIDLGS
jgi:hypothetical protein